MSWNPNSKPRETSGNVSLPTMSPPNRATPRVTAKEMACRMPWNDGSTSPVATSGNTSAMLPEAHAHVTTSSGQRASRHVGARKRFELPVSVNLRGGCGGGDGSHDGAQNAGHAMKVMNAARVLNLQLLLQDRLKTFQARLSNFSVPFQNDWQGMLVPSSGQKKILRVMN